MRPLFGTPDEASGHKLVALNLMPVQLDLILAAGGSPGTCLAADRVT